MLLSKMNKVKKNQGPYPQFLFKKSSIGKEILQVVRLQSNLNTTGATNHELHFGKIIFNFAIHLYSIFGYNKGGHLFIQYWKWKANPSICKKKYWELIFSAYYLHTAINFATVICLANFKERRTESLQSRKRKWKVKVQGERPWPKIIRKQQKQKASMLSNVNKSIPNSITGSTDSYTIE